MLQAAQWSGRAELAGRSDPQLTAMDQLLCWVSTLPAPSASARLRTPYTYNSEVPH